MRNAPCTTCQDGKLGPLFKYMGLGCSFAAKVSGEIAVYEGSHFDLTSWCSCWIKMFDNAQTLALQNGTAKSESEWQRLQTTFKTHASRMKPADIVQELTT
eukprot:551506-Alexandrium_andersonii.AAC.1